MRKGITDEVGYDIRYSTTLDETALMRWMKDPEAVRWFPPDKEGEVESFVRNWIGFSRYQSSLTALYEGTPVGIATIFLMPYMKVAHLCLMYMIVDPQYYRQGIGTSLVRNIKHLAKTRFRLESMHVEAFEGCGIIPLLKQQGFKEIVKQDKFVKFPEGYVPRYILETEL